MKKFFTFLITCTSFITLSACASSDNTANNSTTQSTDEQNIKIDALGNEVEVPNNPKRIIGSYLEDFLVALDTTPVAQWTVGSGSIQAYLQDELKDIPTINYDLPYEDVLAYEPDLLLIESNGLVEGDKYQEYSKIAPTYVVKNGNDVTWRDKLNDIASVLNKEDLAKKVIADYDQLVDDTKNDYSAKIEGKSIAVIWVVNNSAFMVADNRSSGDLLYNQLGFEIPQLTAEISETAEADWSSVSLEKLAELDSDYLILINSDEEAEMFKNQIWQNLPAVKNGNLWEFLPSSSWQYNGPIAYTKMIADVKAQLN